jgi:PAS domain S-box-containing protein
MTINLLISIIVTVSFSLTALYVVIARRHRPTWRAGVTLLLACAGLTLAHALLGFLSDPTIKALCYKLVYVGFTITPTAFLYLALHYSGYGHVLTNRTRLALSIFPAVTAGVILTNGLHGLMWDPAKTVFYANSGGFLVRSDAGIWYWLFVTYSYLVMGLGCFFLIRSLVRSHSVFGAQAGIVIFAAVLAMLGTVLDIIRVSPLPPFATSALGLAIGSITVAYLISPLRQRVLLSTSREAIFYHISDGIIVMDEDGQVVDVNPAAEKLMGRPALQAVGKPLRQLMPALSSIRSRDANMDGEVTLYYEETPRVFELRVFATQGWPNQVASQVVVLHDITTRNRVESEARERQFFVQHVTSTVPEIIFVTDLVKREILYLSESLPTILGYEVVDVLSGEVGWFSLIHPEDISAIQQNDVQVSRARDGENIDAEYRMKHKNGSWRWLHARNVVFARDPQGQVCQMLGVAQDITDRKRTEQLIQVFNKTALSIQGASSPAEVFNVVSDDLNQIGFSCAFWRLDIDQRSLKIEHLNFPLGSVQAVERLPMSTAGSTVFPVDSIEEFRKSAQEKQSFYIEKMVDVIQQLPGPFDRLASLLMEALQASKAIITPLIIDGQVIGLFTVQSDDLRAEDVPMITAFAHQLEMVWPNPNFSSKENKKTPPHR